MSITPISGLSASYIQSLLSALGSSSSTSGKSKSTSGTDALGASIQDSNQISPFAQMLSELQQLQQSDPSKYQQVTQQISTNLTTAANTATSEGNTTAATQLNQLATDFSNASTSGQLPNVQDLAQAVAGGHHHHHHFHGGSGSSSSSSTDGSSSTDSSTNSSTSANASLQQLLSAFSSGSASNNAIDPLSIISTTLSDAGVTSST